MTPIGRPDPNEAVLDGSVFARLWFRWVSRVTSILGGREPLLLSTYTVAGLPDPTQFKNCSVMVSNEAHGNVPAYSDGVHWRRYSDNATVTI